MTWSLLPKLNPREGRTTTSPGYFGVGREFDIRRHAPSLRLAPIPPDAVRAATNGGWRAAAREPEWICLYTQPENIDSAMVSSPLYIVIKGITDDGRRFRPSDWAERLATAVGEFGPDRRVHFHPQVRIATVDDTKCVLVDEGLQQSDPMLFDFLVHFARDNHLQMESDVSFGEKGRDTVRA